MQRFKGSKEFAIAVVATLVVAAMSGCNLTGGVDSATKSNEDIMSEAQALMDKSDCGKAVSKLEAAGSKTNEMYRLLGWAYMCSAGAPLAKIADTLLKYSSSTGDLTIIGKLANKMVPSGTDAITSLNSAMVAFGNVDDPSLANDKAVNIALAHLAKAAARIAMQTTNGTTVQKTDISPSSCSGQVCTSAPAGCNGGMSANDANEVGNELLSASSVVGANSSLGAVKDLASRFGTLASASTAAINRCTIFNQIISTN